MINKLEDTAVSNYIHPDINQLFFEKLLLLQKKSAHLLQQILIENFEIKSPKKKQFKKKQYKILKKRNKLSVFISDTRWEVQKYEGEQYRYHINCSNCVKCGRNMYELKIMSDPEGTPSGPSCYDCEIPPIATH